MALCSCKEVSFQYPYKKNNALSNISLEINEGEFIVLCGQSGCGKTTLLRQFKPALQPYGTREGEVMLKGQPLHTLSDMDSAVQIGYVMQQADHQIVTDKVWHELAFGLENIGCPPNEMKRKIAEMVTFFGMQNYFHKDCDTISGGQKQILNLASIMLLQPKLLLLDEPTSQLDPIAAKEFLHILHQINTEFGTTILIAEHHLEDVFAIASRIVVMEKGRILCEDDPQHIAFTLAGIHPQHPMFETFPTPIRLYQKTQYEHQYPIHVKDAQRYLRKHVHPSHCKPLWEDKKERQEVLCCLKDIYFRYDYQDADVLHGVCMELHKQDIYALLGANGAGKSTLLRMLCGIEKPYRGTYTYEGANVLKSKHASLLKRIAYVPQDISSMFMKDEILLDFTTLCDHQKDRDKAYERMHKWIKAFHLEPLLHHHPYDISGGEQQRVALCKALIKEADVLLLDEPTKGLDSFMKAELAHILQQLNKEGLTILLVTHDIEFSAQYASKVGLLFDKELITQDTPHNFFKGNQFYTTAAHRIAKGFYDDAITCEEVIAQCQIHRK